MSLLSFCSNHELKILFDIADTNVESSEPIQPDITGASSAVPPLQTEATTEKVLYPLCHPFVINLFKPPNQDFLIHRHSIFQPQVTLSIWRSILMKMKLDCQPPPLRKFCQKRPEIS